MRGRTRPRPRPGKCAQVEAEIISTYLPEVVPNERHEPSIDKEEEFSEAVRRFTGTTQYNLDSDFLLTDGAKWLLDHLGSYDLLGLLWVFLPALWAEPLALTLIDWEPSGAVHVHDGCGPRRTLARAELDVGPPEAVRLFTGAVGARVVVMLASEY